MEDLIKALQIFLKYGNPEYPTHCEHEILYIVGINPDDVSDEDKAELEKLGFNTREDGEHFTSFRFGST
jgi:hypothetical protein